MPVIRVMNWNIESLSFKKLAIPGMAAAIARTVAAANVDVLIVLEVKTAKVNVAMSALSAALNGAEPGPGTNWERYFLSYPSGVEYCCVFIRNLNLIRPVYPSGGGPVGDSGDQLINLDQNTFVVWPSANFGVSAYPAALPPHFIPLLDVYATLRPDRPGKQRTAFGGQPIGRCGYSLGRGYRLPALLLLAIRGAMVNYLVPIVICHYAASRGTRNVLGESQVGQLKDLHIAQLFDFHSPAGGPAPVPTSGYLDVRDAAGVDTAVRVQELIFTGDFNLDYLNNLNGGSADQQMIYNAYSGLTPTQRSGGSAAPAAAAGAAGPVPPVLPVPGPYPPGPLSADVGAQTLRAAVTSQGTIMWNPDSELIGPPPAGGPDPAPYTTKALDNFLYGGTQLATAPAVHGLAGIDSGQVINVPANIVNPGAVAAPGQVDLSGPAAHHLLADTRNAASALRLQAPLGPWTALSDLDRLVGARMVSDHLPVVLSFNCP